MSGALKILRNAARCNACKEVIESKHRHDFRSCSCGNLQVDGGRDYLKRCFGAAGYEELSGVPVGKGGEIEIKATPARRKRSKP